MQYWDSAKQCAVANPDGGDTLARFVAWELYESFVPDADDQQQIETAIQKMRIAADTLQGIVKALEGLKRERAAAA